MMSFKVVLAFIVVAAANAGEITWTSAARSTSLVSGAAGGDLVVKFTPATAVTSSGTLTITASAAIFKADAAATACTLTSGAAVQTAVVACATTDGSAAAPTAGCNCGNAGFIAAAGKFCDTALLSTGVALTTAKCANTVGSASPGAICSCGKNNVQISTSEFCWVKTDKDGIKSAATVPVCPTTDGSAAATGTTCYCGAGSAVVTPIGGFCDTALLSTGVSLTTAKCANAVMGASTAAICSCGKNDVQVPATGFCFVNAGAASPNANNGVTSVAIAPAVVVTAAVTGTKKILTITPASNILAAVGVLTCTSNLAVNGAAGAVTFSIKSSTDTTEGTGKTGYTVTAAVAPTPAPTNATATTIAKIVQTMKFEILAAAYTGTVKTLVEASYGLLTEICTGNCTSYKTGYAMTSAAARRASCTVTFTVTVPNAAASTAVTTKATAVTKDTMTAKITAVKTQIGSTATAPAVKSVATPGGSKKTGTAAASTIAVSMFSAVCLSMVALRQ